MMLAVGIALSGTGSVTVVVVSVPSVVSIRTLFSMKPEYVARRIVVATPNTVRALRAVSINRPLIFGMVTWNLGDRDIFSAEVLGMVVGVSSTHKCAVSEVVTICSESVMGMAAAGLVLVVSGWLYLAL